MFATLIAPAEAPRPILEHKLNFYENTGFGYIGRAFRVGELMGADPTEVSVLDAGPDYIIWVNPRDGRNCQAEQVLGQFITSATFGGEEDDLGKVFGPVLILTSRQIALDTPAALVAPAPVSFQDWLPEAEKAYGTTEKLGGASYLRGKEAMLNERLATLYTAARELGCSQQLLNDVTGGYAQGYRERLGAELMSRVAYHEQQQQGASREQLFPFAQKISSRQWAMIQFHTVLPELINYVKKEMAS